MDDNEIYKLSKQLEKLQKQLEKESKSSRSRRKKRKHSRSRSRSRSKHGHRSRRRSRTDSRSRHSSAKRSRSKSLEEHLEDDPDDQKEEPVDQKEDSVDQKLDLIDLTTTTTPAPHDGELDSEILALLGDAPEQDNNGPDLLPSLVSRWEYSYILKKGLDKEQKMALIKKYPPPGNFKLLDAPKLNPEAQAAAGEAVLKRDKAIEYKQKQVSCAITALGMALGTLCKEKTTLNQECIHLISDAARLLCDYHSGESLTRKNFILTGLDKSIRDGIKENETDQWLFGSGLAEKLKACKAIKRTGQELIPYKRPPPKNNNLNAKGKTNNTFKPKNQNQKDPATPAKKRNFQPQQSQQKSRSAPPRNSQHQHNSGHRR